jgi:diguanylate cyclase (GGDEF)-like protein
LIYDGRVIVMAVSPVRSPKGIQGALLIGARLNHDQLVGHEAGQEIDLALAADGRLIATSSHQARVRNLLADQELSLTTLGRLNASLIGERIYAAAQPLDDESLLIALISTADLAAAGQQRLLITLGSVGLLILALILVNHWLLSGIAAPVRAMIAATRDIIGGRFERRIETGTLQELNELGEAVNHLAEQVQRQIDELTHQAFHDALSSLPNRALFLDRLAHALQRASQQQAVAVMFIDLDNFKVINDSLGHQVGDQLLVAFARRLRTAVRPEDTVARFGGDEFTILLERVTAVEQATGIAERLADWLRQPFIVDGHEIFTAASVGIALGTSGEDEPETLLREADVAMYRAKTSGKAQYALFETSMTRSVIERLELETDLRRALERGELALHYQPIVRIADRRLVEVEALLRWHHPSRGIISPAQFIPIAEETGLILPIGDWVLREACRQARQWQLAYPTEPPLTVSVNLSGHQFQQPGLTERVADILSETDLPAASLKLEITESATMRDTAVTLDQLHRLKGLGLKLAIDDFGTGYSSLAYLKSLPIDLIKIDRSFLKEIGQNVEDAAIVRAIVALAKTLNLTVTGEGLETPEQVHQLDLLSCDLGQGFYFSRPLPAAALADLLAVAQSEPLPLLSAAAAA